MEMEWDKIVRFIKGKADNTEKEEIAHWAKEDKHRKRFLKEAFEFYSKEEGIFISYDDTQRAWNRINPVRRRRVTIFKYSSAAAILVFLITVLSVLNPFQNIKDNLPHFKPGEERATLALAGESVVELGADEKTLKNISVVTEPKSKKAVLVIDVKDRASEALYKLNEIVVPKYAEYQINLEDGTRVWLNSETKMKFPLKFSGNERSVFISGEAYFQVAHNAEKPFIVHLNESTQIKVLGTEFNVRTYEDELSQSTLISGSIELKHNGKTTMVNPGESCIVDNATGQVNIREADIMSVTSWKNGEFVFRNETLEYIIKELSRWYNINVVIENEELKNERFYLYFNRTTGFEDIINQITKTGKINYNYKNKSIVIY